MPAQFEGVFPLDTVFDATIEFSTEIVDPVAAIRPPALVVAVPPSLEAIVELVTAMVLLVHRTHRLTNAPPPPCAVLLTTVELSTVTLAVVRPLATLSIAPAVPPTPLDEKLRLSSSSEWVTVSVPFWFSIAPPAPPVTSPRTSWSSLRVSVPWLSTFPPDWPFEESALPNSSSKPEIVTVGLTPDDGSGRISNTRALGELTGVVWSIVVVRAPAPATVMFSSITSGPVES